MKYLPTIARILLGLVFFVSGLGTLLHLFPQPPHEGKAQEFLMGLAASGYMLPLLKVTETLMGLLLLIGRFVPLALTILAPIIINIAAFHFALDPKGAPVAVLLILFEGFLAWAYRDSFRSVLAANAKPTGAA